MFILFIYFFFFFFLVASCAHVFLIICCIHICIFYIFFSFYLLFWCILCLRISDYMYPLIKDKVPNNPPCVPDPLTRWPTNPTQQKIKNKISFRKQANKQTNKQNKTNELLQLNDYFIYCITLLEFWWLLKISGKTIGFEKAVQPTQEWNRYRGTSTL